MDVMEAQLPLFKPRRKAKVQPTSAAAYRSKTKAEITKLQQEILYRLIAGGPQTDTQLWMHWKFSNVSGSSLRTRRAELVKLGKVVDSGKRVRLRSGRMSIVWKAA